MLRQVYDHTDPGVAEAWIDELMADATSADLPVEVRRLGRTVTRWRDQITAWHAAHVTNGPTESMNNLIKRIAFGFRRSRHFRVRALPHAGKPDWPRLTGLAPR